MRLNQLAKKVGKPYTRVEKFLIKECGLEYVDGPNTKVSDEIIEKVIYKFGLADNKSSVVKKVTLATVEAVEAQIMPEEKGIEEIDITLIRPTPAESVKPIIKLEDVKITKPNSEVVVNEKIEDIVETAINTEIEEIKENTTLIDTGETTLHISDEGVVKVPKVTLDGIKVMGKIDLPQDKVKEEEEEEEEEVNGNLESAVETEVDPVIEKPQKVKKKGPSSEEIDAKRIKRLEAHKKAEKAAFEKENEKLKQKEKAAKKDHYVNQKKTAPKSPKKKSTKSNQQYDDDKAFDTKEKYQNTENLTTYQKIVKWFNT
tara:strand:- start:113 stop:1057 length:945 start_codon:yes stop_codon:yes gene_type:complete